MAIMTQEDEKMQLSPRQSVMTVRWYAIKLTEEIGKPYG
jgi:hypothetical protein